MSAVAALGSGLVGSCALTAAHQLLRGATSDAPRMDVLGERAIAKSFHAAGLSAPAGEQLHRASLAGDIVSNSLYYSLVGVAGPEAAPVCGGLLGLLAGVGAVALPGPLGLGNAPSGRTPATRAMAVGIYLLGGLAAGVAYKYLASGRR